MRRIILFYVTVLFLFMPSMLYAACSGSSPTWTAASHSVADVSDCITSASTGDTINIPVGDGSETWNSALSVTKNVIIKGPGKSNLTITGGGSNELITYAPSTPSATSTFEISGLTLNGNNSTRVISFTHSSTTVMQQLKIHDLDVTNSGVFAAFVGLYKGVIYNNTINISGQLQQNVGPSDDGLAAWNAIQKCSGSPLICSHDDGRNLYWEDNSITTGDTVLESGGAGFSWVARYNTINFSNTSPGFEWHGNYGTGCATGGTQRCSSMDMAMYGNLLHRTSGTKNPYIQPRGGMGMIFYNYSDSSASINMYFQDECSASVGACSETTNLQSQNISDTYAWVNPNTNNVIPGVYSEADDTGEIAENVSYFVQRSGTFDGSGDDVSGGGVGCGTLANRPETCTTGVGYWATNQDCSNISDYVGANPTTPISGTLYKCNSEGTGWDVYYTPYTYPHPLRVRKFTGNVMIGGAGLFN